MPQLILILIIVLFSVIAYLLIGFICAYWLSWLDDEYTYQKKSVDAVIARCVVLFWPAMLLIHFGLLALDYGDPYKVVSKARWYTEKRKLRNSDMD